MLIGSIEYPSRGQMCGLCRRWIGRSVARGAAPVQPAGDDGTRLPMLSCGPTPQTTRDPPAERMTTRIGIATGYDPALDVRDFARTVHEVDERGYDIAFFSETFALMRDSVSAMAAFALASQRITLG